MKSYVKMTPSNKSKFCNRNSKSLWNDIYQILKDYCLYYYHQPRLVYSAKPCFITEERKTCHDKYKLKRIVEGTYTLKGDKHIHGGIGKISHSRMVNKQERKPTVNIKLHGGNSDFPLKPGMIQRCLFSPPLKIF